MFLILSHLIWMYAAYKAYDNGYKDGYYAGLGKNGELK